jgi:putative salt-induced outer membrane protein YdiY
MYRSVCRLALVTTLSLNSAIATAEEALEPDAGLLSTGLLQGWERELEVGINGSDGNSESLSIHAGFKADYKDSEDVWKFRAAYDKASSDGEESRNQFFADLEKDWLWTESDWFAFAQGRYDWDEYKDWDQRISFSVGPGYQFVKNNTWDISGRVGLGGNKTYGNEDEDFTLEALLGMNVGWTISERESVDFATTYYPSLDDGGEYRNITTLDWKMKMEERGKLAMKIGLSNEYDSEATGDDEKNDFKYYLALVWGM